MGFRGNNRDTFAEYVELEIAIYEYSPNDYLFKRLETDWFSDLFNGSGKCNGLIDCTDQYKLTGKHLVPYCLRHFYTSQSI